MRKRLRNFVERRDVRAVGAFMASGIVGFCVTIWIAWLFTHVTGMLLALGAIGGVALGATNAREALRDNPTVNPITPIPFGALVCLAMGAFMVFDPLYIVGWGGYLVLVFSIAGGLAFMSGFMVMTWPEIRDMPHKSRWGFEE